MFLSKLEEIKKLIEQNRPKAEIARILSIKYDTLNSYFKKYGIEYKGNPNRKGIPHTETRIPLKDILENKVFYHPNALKKRLIEEGLKEQKCEICGINKWNGKEICLELHHIDGNQYNNNMSNLQVLCPNCHSQTDNYRNRNRKIKNIKNEVTIKDNKKISKIREIVEVNKVKSQLNMKTKTEKPKRFCQYCGAELKYNQLKYCSKECSHNAISKRPPVMQLLEKYNELDGNLCALGRFYNVSDNAIRKWLKLYKII